jgi:hypothetical protein
MTTQENQQYQKLQKKAYKGLTFDEWNVLKQLRKKQLIINNENPDHYNLECRYFSKKLHYRQ